MSDFRHQVLKLNLPRHHKVTNSLGVYDAYKYIRKNKWFDIGQPVSEHNFYSIIRMVNSLLADCLLEQQDIILPLRMGIIEVRKYRASISFDGKKVVTNLPIDWDRTIKLWAEDEECYKKRTLIKMEEKEMFKIYYNRTKANYDNKAFYSFLANRELKLRLKDKIKLGRFDAFSF